MEYAKELFGGSYGARAPGFTLPENFPAVDWENIYVSSDRICVRLPTEMSTPVEGTRKERKRVASRGLTPHLDCCPETVYESVIEEAAALERDSAEKKSARSALTAARRSPAAVAGEGATAGRPRPIGEEEVMYGNVVEQYAAARVLYRPHLPPFETLLEGDPNEKKTAAGSFLTGAARRHRAALSWEALARIARMEELEKLGCPGDPPCGKFRPVQCFLSLSDTLVENTGGIEIAGGYHKTFEEWTGRRNGGAREGERKKKAREQEMNLGVYKSVERAVGFLAKKVAMRKVAQGGEEQECTGK